MYPLGRFPTHPFRVLGFSALGTTIVNEEAHAISAISDLAGGLVGAFLVTKITSAVMSILVIKIIRVI
jgi:hypothetical protein